MYIHIYIYIHMYIYETCGVVPCFPVKKFPFKPSLASTKGHKKMLSNFVLANPISLALNSPILWSQIIYNSLNHGFWRLFKIRTPSKPIDHP